MIKLFLVIALSTTIALVSAKKEGEGAKTGVAHQDYYKTSLAYVNGLQSLVTAVKKDLRSKISSAAQNKKKKLKLEHEYVKNLGEYIKNDGLYQKITKLSEEKYQTATSKESSGANEVRAHMYGVASKISELVYETGQLFRLSVKHTITIPEEFKKAYNTFKAFFETFIEEKEKSGPDTGTLPSYYMQTKISTFLPDLPDDLTTSYRKEKYSLRTGLLGKLLIDVIFFYVPLKYATMCKTSGSSLDEYMSISTCYRDMVELITHSGDGTTVKEHYTQLKSNQTTKEQLKQIESKLKSASNEVMVVGERILNAGQVFGCQLDSFYVEWAKAIHNDHVFYPSSDFNFDSDDDIAALVADNSDTTEMQTARLQQGIEIFEYFFEFLIAQEKFLMEMLNEPKLQNTVGLSGLKIRMYYFGIGGPYLSPVYDIYGKLVMSAGYKAQSQLSLIKNMADQLVSSMSEIFFVCLKHQITMTQEFTTAYNEFKDYYKTLPINLKDSQGTKSILSDVPSSTMNADQYIGEVAHEELKQMVLSYLYAVKYHWAYCKVKSPSNVESSTAAEIAIDSKINEVNGWTRTNPSMEAKKAKFTEIVETAESETGTNDCSVCSFDNSPQIDVAKTNVKLLIGMQEQYKNYGTAKTTPSSEKCSTTTFDQSKVTTYQNLINSLRTDVNQLVSMLETKFKETSIAIELKWRYQPIVTEWKKRVGENQASGYFKRYLQEFTTRVNAETNNCLKQAHLDTIIVLAVELASTVGQLQVVAKALDITTLPTITTRMTELGDQLKKDDVEWYLLDPNEQITSDAEKKALPIRVYMAQLSQVSDVLIAVTKRYADRLGTTHTSEKKEADSFISYTKAVREHLKTLKAKYHTRKNYEIEYSEILGLGGATKYLTELGQMTMKFMVKIDHTFGGFAVGHAKDLLDAVKSPAFSAFYFGSGPTRLDDLLSD